MNWLRDRKIAVYTVLRYANLDQFITSNWRYRNTLRRFNEVVKRITVDIEADPETNWRVLKHIRSFNEKIFGKVETTI